MGLLPLNCSRRLRGDVVDDPVDAAHLVDDAPGAERQEFVVEGEGIGGHAVGRGDGAKRADEIVGPGVAHDADGLDRQKHGEGLPDGVVEAVVADFVEVDGVGAAQDFDLFRRHLAGDPDRQPRPRRSPA